MEEGAEEADRLEGVIGERIREFVGRHEEVGQVKRWVEGSSHTRSVIAKRIREKRQPGQTTVEFNFEYNATMYDDEDMKDSFGTI